ncbi:hypothetical protein ACWDZ8_25880 [Streptomyces sp. NPDC003233]
MARRHPHSRSAAGWHPCPRFFGDIERTDDVYRELRARCGPRAVDLLKQCQSGAHAPGARITDPHRFVDEIQDLAQKVRKPEVTA